MDKELKYRQFADLIEIMLNHGFIELEDLFPVIRKGTAKMMREPEEKIFKEYK